MRVAGHWLTDFASCNYLGLDLDPEVIAGVPEYLARWGTHSSWARGIASPALYQQVEAEVAELLGVEDALALPTLTHTHFGVLPALAGEGTLLLDLRAHRTMPLWPPGQRNRSLLRRVLRPGRAHRRVLQGVLVPAGLRRLPERAQAPPQGGGAVLRLLGPGPGGVAGHGPAGPGGQPAPGRRPAGPALAADPGPPRPPGQAGGGDLQHLGLPAGRAGPGRPRGPGRGRAAPVRPRHLRDPRPLPGGAAGRDRLPHPADRGQHRRAGRPPAGRPRGGRRPLRLPPPHP